MAVKNRLSPALGNQRIDHNVTAPNKRRTAPMQLLQIKLVNIVHDSIGSVRRHTMRGNPGYLIYDYDKPRNDRFSTGVYLIKRILKNALKS